MSKDADYFNAIYKDIAEQLGVETAVSIFDLYKGMQISFPVKLYSYDYIKDAIIREYDGHNTKELAHKYRYSERTIRRIINNK